MKKFLAMLGTLSLVASSAATVIACTDSKKEDSQSLAELKSVLTQPNLGKFEAQPTEEQLKDRVTELNAKLNWNEVNIVIDSSTKKVKIVVKKDSKVYKAGEIELTYTIGLTQEEQFSKFALERAKSLVLAENYGLDHKSTHDVIKSSSQNSSKYDQLFNDKSINEIKNSDLKLQGTVGKKGSIFDLILNDNTKSISDSLKDLPSELQLILGTNKFEDGMSASEEVTVILDSVLVWFSTILGGIWNTGGLLSIIPGILDMINVLPDAITGIQNSFNEFKEKPILKEKVQPILRGLAVGSDLTRFENLTVNQMYSALIFSIINVLHYGFENDYQEPDIVEQSKNGNYNEAVNYLINKFLTDNKEKKVIPKSTSEESNQTDEKVPDEKVPDEKVPDEKVKEDTGFSFDRNLGKIVENLITSATILNTILSIYRTPEINLNTEPGEGKTRSEYLFSNEQTNDDFVRAKSIIVVKDLKLNLKGLNLGEFVTNIKYYLGGSQHSLQKLIYIMLFSGTKGAVSYGSPLFEFIFTLINVKWLKLSWFELSAAKVLILNYIINPIANNKLLPVKVITNSNGIWKFIGPKLNEMFPGLGDKIRDLLLQMEELLGTNIISTLYSGNLRTILEMPEIEDLFEFIKKSQIEKAEKEKAEKEAKEKAEKEKAEKEKVEKEKVEKEEAEKNQNGENVTTFENSVEKKPEEEKEKQKSFINLEDIMKPINAIFGETGEINLKNLLTKVKLGNILGFAKIPGFNQNANVPNHFSWFANKSISELIDELTGYLLITGKETTEQLKDYTIDFSLVETIFNELFYEANGKETGLINQIIDNLNDKDELFKILGYVDLSDSRNPIFKADSFIGRILTLVMPGVTKAIDEKTGTISLSAIEKLNLKDTLIWMLGAINKIVPKLIGASNLKPFVETVISNEEAWTNQINKILFENSTDLKGSVITIEFDPSLITFNDGTKLAGPKVKYEFIVDRTTKSDKFNFTKITKTIIQEKKPVA